MKTDMDRFMYGMEVLGGVVAACYLTFLFGITFYIIWRLVEVLL